MFDSKIVKLFTIQKNTLENMCLFLEAKLLYEYVCPSLTHLQID